MILVFGPYAGGKKEYVQNVLGYGQEDFSPDPESECPVVYDAQLLASGTADLKELALSLAQKDVVIATETGCGVVPMDAAERAAREAAGRLNILLAEAASHVIRIWWGIPETIK